MRNAPCYGCDRRTEVCHTDCAAYRAWTVHNVKERELARVAVDADAHTKATIERNCKRSKTKRRVGQR